MNRAASLSKTITAATAMKLVEDGKLDLDAPVLPMLGLEPPDYPGAAFDPRWTNVTLRHCLNHTGGWNRDTAKDPLGVTSFEATFWPDRIAQGLKLPTAATSTDMVTWMLGKPMQSRPGTAFAYCNSGYQVAGTLIEKVVGAPFEEAARALLSKAGITRMHVGTDTWSGRRPGEAVYYLHPSITPAWARSLSEPKPFNVDLPYAWPVSLYGASGGWAISTIDYARFVASIDTDPSYPDVLTTNTIAVMVARPKTSPLSEESYYGLGVNVRPGTRLWSHGGADIGWRSFWAKSRDGVISVFTMNTYWEAQGGFDLWSTFSPILDGIRQWPTHDLFPNTLSYEAWETKHLSSHGALALGYGSDPDRDGTPNLVEFTLGADPLMASPRPALTATVDQVDGQRTLTIGFLRLLLAHEVDYFLEASEDLKSWSPVEGESSEPSLNSDGTVTVQTRTRITTPEAMRNQFFRLVVSRKKV